jgi:hypothetical protein
VSIFVDELPAVLFLDVDGVLHPTTVKHPRQQFKAECMALLREVVEQTGATIVLSTMWRLHAEAREHLSAKLAEHGCPQFVSRTRDIAQWQRQREILAWVNKHRPVTWVAVDDWPLHETAGCPRESAEMNGHFVQTRPRHGLQRDRAERIKLLFQAQKESREIGLPSNVVALGRSTG